ncbi:hypothetical protein JDS99_29555 [Bacillus cereus group sp. N6]|nr:hypothetical protein [Bacillus cereus group sp. N6]MBJ8113678.1 hypothetical protein [Bacillus cereus group sp. N6]
MDIYTLAGYGAAQAVLGPLFTFASYLGMASIGWEGVIETKIVNIIHHQG